MLKRNIWILDYNMKNSKGFVLYWYILQYSLNVTTKLLWNIKLLMYWYWKQKGKVYSHISEHITIHKIVVYITCFKYIDIYSSHSIDMVNGKKIRWNCFYLQNTFHLIRILIYVLKFELEKNKLVYLKIMLI